jgi:hypothetical protein
LHHHGTTHAHLKTMRHPALGCDVKARTGIEALREKLGIKSARSGVPFSLMPLDPGDHMLPKIMGTGETEPSFETFTDGSMAPSAVAYYLRALSIYGLGKNAEAMAADLESGFRDGLFTGGMGASMGEGNEFLSWEGLPSGYEGTFGPNFGTLYAIAVAKGVLQPTDPEWWPANG